MKKIIILAFVGLAAQLVDGSLGMAYGVTSTSLLLAFGIAPAVASASVHMAEIVTTAASGLSHIRFNNADKQVVKKLMIPGSIGAFLGALFLGSIPGNMIKPYVSFFLLCLGVFVLYRFLFSGKPRKKVLKSEPKKKSLIPLGFIAGFFDAIGGGGWGPITTPVLLTSSKMEPRKVIGSVDTSEFAIAVSASLGFLLSLGWSKVHLEWVLALMIGGIIAAPIAAWLVSIFPSTLLGTLVGGLIIMTNIRTLLVVFHVSQTVSFYIHLFIGILWITAVILVLYKMRKNSVALRQ